MAPSAVNTTPINSKPSSKIDFTTFKNTINNDLIDSSEHHHGINPATKQRLADVPVATKEDLDVAVAAARAASKKWRNTPREERNRCVLAFADIIEANADELAKLLTTEQGKPISQASFEVGGCIAWLRAQTTIVIEDEVLEDSEERKVSIRYIPLGVVGAIVPWNFPCLLCIGKVGPAVLTGNTIIIKPSPFTPYTALKLAELASSCFPPGVVQALSGSDDLGPWMTTHEGIDKISFTGSTETGKKVAASAASTLKRITLELGGKDPAIICADVDITKVAAEVSTHALLNSGQICLAIKRIYVHSSIYAKFRDAMVTHIGSLKVGDGFATDTFCGPIQNDMQYKKVKDLFCDIEKEGWKIAIGGTIDRSAIGYYITPTLIDNPKDDSRIVTEEPFGPILPILSWDSEEEVVERANNTDFGLGASVWSRDLDQADRICRQLECGNAWINTHFDMSPMFPFGGHKQSGLGVEWGISGLKSYCNQQTYNVRKRREV